MASKVYASPAEAFDDSTPYRESVCVQIKGLRQVGEDTFEIEGMTMQEVDWGEVQRVLGRRLSDHTLDDIADIIFRHDVAEFLSQGIIRK